MTPTIGATISEIDLNGKVTKAAYNEISKALWRHHVVFLRGQELEPEAYIRLIRRIL
jgi:alpha-ketoglutarate-dependent taurine dioxygenase